MRVRFKNNLDVVLKMSYEEVYNNGLLYVVRRWPFQVEYKTAVIITVAREHLHEALPILDAAAPDLRIPRYFKAVLIKDRYKLQTYYDNMCFLLTHSFLLRSIADNRKAEIKMGYHHTMGEIDLWSNDKSGHNIRSMILDKNLWSSRIERVPKLGSYSVNSVQHVVDVLTAEFERVVLVIRSDVEALRVITCSSGCGDQTTRELRSGHSLP